MRLLSGGERFFLRRTDSRERSAVVRPGVAENKIKEGHQSCCLFSFFFFHIHIFFLPSVFVAGLRPESMAASLHGCGGRSQTKCQLGHIVAAIKATPHPPHPPSGTAWVRPRCTLGLWDNIDGRERSCAARGEGHDRRRGSESEI